MRRYATAATAEQLITGTRMTRPGLLGPHQAYLRQRWDDGARSTERLHQELRERGHRGSLRTLRRLTSQLRQDTAIPAPPPAPAAKKVVSWILTPPGKLADGNRAALAQITARCEELKATPLSGLRGFAKGLRKDWAAVTAGLTVPYSSGPVEGHVKVHTAWLGARVWWGRPAGWQARARPAAAREPRRAR